jgi:hypothetical protein
MPRLELIIVENRGVKFVNDCAQVWFNLVADPENDGNKWYAGSTTSAVLSGWWGEREILDAEKADWPSLYMFHDREKRCMQIDQIQLYDSRGGEKLGDAAQLFDKPYRLIANSERVQPEFVEVTVASSPFDCTYAVGGKPRQLECELHRVIRLEADANYLDEKLSIHVRSGAEPMPWYAVRYYAHINAGWSGLSVLSSGGARAFAAGASWGARPTYAFACDAPIEELEVDAFNVRAWVSPCKSLECRHVFARGEEWRKVLDVASRKTSAHGVANAAAGAGAAGAAARAAAAGAGSGSVGSKP